MIGQTPYTRRGRRGGRPFRGGGSGHFGSRPDGSVPTFHGRGRGRGRGGQFSVSAENPTAFVQGESSHTPGEPSPYASGPAQALLAAPAPAPAHATIWPPPHMAWCHLCRVDCNTLEILEQHRSGKKHKKNLQLYEELQELNRLRVGGQNKQMPIPEVQQAVPIQSEKVEGSEEKQHPQENLSSQAVTDENKVETEQQDVSEVESAEEPGRKPGMDHFGSRERGFKRKMRGGRDGKWMRIYEGSRRPVGPAKPEQVIPLICELCNVKCDSQVVFDSHLIGKKHHSNLKRFQGQQAILGQATLQALCPALQALYPALPALYPPNPNATTSFGPQFHQGGNGSQGLSPHPLMFHPGQASVPGLATTSASAPPPVLENLAHQNPKPVHSLVTSEAVSQDAAKGKPKLNSNPSQSSLQLNQLASVKTKSENGTSDFVPEGG